MRFDKQKAGIDPTGEGTSGRAAWSAAEVGRRTHRVESGTPNGERVRIMQAMRRSVALLSVACGLLPAVCGTALAGAFAARTSVGVLRRSASRCMRMLAL
jgi:hypothetical protein